MGASWSAETPDPSCILQGESSEDADKGRKQEPVLVLAKVAEHEIAWERNETDQEDEEEEQQETG